MEYVSNDKYRIEINGVEVVASAEDLREAFLDIRKMDGNSINDYIEPVSFNYIFEDSAKYELLTTEIIDDGYKDVKWSSELESILETAVEAAMATSHNWYTSLYHMERKI
jgi:hypothetical protein